MSGPAITRTAVATPPGRGKGKTDGSRGRAAPFLWALLLLLPACAVLPEPASNAEPARDILVGPPAGTVIVAGGGTLGPAIWTRIVELAGGADGHIVVIPTAGTRDDFPDDWNGADELRRAGAGRITILHTRDREEADSEAFVRPLRDATGVWIPGGRQWRLVDAYLGTRVHQALFEVLERGGVVGGTSAGASIQGSFLVRGDPSTNQVVIAPGYEEGFGLLAGTAVDQHLLARERENDLWQVLELHPDLLGIGLDEGTAMVVQGNRAEVIGSSQALIYDPRGMAPHARNLRPGDVFDLGRRMMIPTDAQDDARGTSGSD